MSWNGLEFECNNNKKKSRSKNKNESTTPTTKQQIKFFLYK